MNVFLFYYLTLAPTGFRSSCDSLIAFAYCILPVTRFLQMYIRHGFSYNVIYEFGNNFSDV